MDPEKDQVKEEEVILKKEKKKEKKSKKKKKSKKSSNNNNQDSSENLQQRISDFLNKTLSEEELTKVSTLREKITPQLKCKRLLHWCDDRTLVRYLRARSWDIAKAYDMLCHSLEWRLKWKPESITADDVKTEMNNKGKMYISSKSDQQGRPIIYMKPGHDNTGPDQRETKIKYLIYMMEKSARRFDTEPALSKGASKCLLLIDYKDTSMSQLVDPRTFGISKEVLDILQNQYPERLGNAFIVNPPWIFSSFWKVIYPLIDPVTKEKIKLWSDKKEWSELHNYIDDEALETFYGGTSDYVYNFEDYWQTEDKLFPPIFFDDEQ